MTAEGESPEPRPTIYDVAREAGVSAATVSRAFSKPDRVSFSTAEKVRAAAERLGYGRDLETRSGTAPDAAGTVGALPRARTNMLGMIVADAVNPFFLEILRGAEHAAATQDIGVALINSNEHEVRARRAAERIIPHVDGLLLVSTRMSSADIQKIARAIPTVVVNRPVQGVPSVLVDNYDGAVKAAAHLVGQGYRSITYIAGPDSSWADANRWRGLVDAAAALEVLSGGAAPRPTSLQLSRSVTVHGAALATMRKPKLQQLRVEEPTFVGGRRAFEQWHRSPTDAVVCFNDIVAMGFIAQARASGLSVPEDVAVVGFDNTEITVLASPTLTTVAGPLRSVGRVSAANLIALIKGLKEPLMARPRMLPTRLIVRESSVRRSSS